VERKRIICLFLFVLLILVFSSCYSTHVSDIKSNMTKEEVVSLWGKTDLITYRTVKGRAFETWEYHFSNPGHKEGDYTASVCWVTFSQDTVVTVYCSAVCDEEQRDIYPEGCIPGPAG